MSHGGWWFQPPKGLESQRGAGLESSHLSGWNSRSDMFEPPQQDCCVYATMLLRPQGVKERLPFSLQVKPKNHVQESTQKIIKSGMGTSQWPCCPEAVSTSALNLKRSKGHMVAAIWLASSQGMILAKDTPRHFKLSVFFWQPLLKVIWKRKRSHGWTSSGPGDKTCRTQERPWRTQRKTVAHLPFWPHPRICRPVQVNTTLTH